MTTEGGGYEVVLKALEVYFDNLSVAAINEKTVLEKLFAINAKLAATNEELVAVVRKVNQRQ